ncbi:MAG: Ribosome maturation factor RimM [Arcobacter lacus]|nr:MAG: Ribosome maturation factor RimM [Arcobacter lacus]
MKKEVYVAKLGKTVGLKGHLRLIADTDFPEQFKKGAVYITNKNSTLTIKEFNNSNQTVQFEEYENIDLVKKLTNQELFTTYEETRKNCQLGHNEFFWFDLLNCKIIEDGKTLGTVTEINRYPSADYLEIKTEESLIESGLPKIFLLPKIFDTYILDVNIESKEIQVQKALEILENS